jgi:hypothetical protein
VGILVVAVREKQLSLDTRVANLVSKGQMDCKVGNCLAGVCGQLLRALEAGDLAERVASLEARLPTTTTNGYARVH